MSRVQVTCSGRGAPGTEPRGVARTAGDAAGGGALRHSAASPGCRPPLVAHGDSRDPPRCGRGAGRGGAIRGPWTQPRITTNCVEKVLRFPLSPSLSSEPCQEESLAGRSSPLPRTPPPNTHLLAPSEPRAWASARLELSNAALFSLFIFPFFWNLTQTFLLRCGCRAHF